MKNHSDALKVWQTLSTEVAFVNPWFMIEKRTVVTSRGAIADYYLHRGADVVICVCVNREGQLLIERQYRPGAAKVSIDLPAGRIEPTDVSPEAAAVRELREEVGFVARTLTKIGMIDKEPAFSHDRVHIFLAEGRIQTTATQEATESIVSTFTDAGKVLELIRGGQMTCAFCTTAVFLAFLHLGWIAKRSHKTTVRAK